MDASSLTNCATYHPSLTSYHPYHPSFLSSPFPRHFSAMAENHPLRHHHLTEPLSSWTNIQRNLSFIFDVLSSTLDELFAVSSVKTAIDFQSYYTYLYSASFLTVQNSKLSKTRHANKSWSPVNHQSIFWVRRRHSVIPWTNENSWNEDIMNPAVNFVKIFNLKRANITLVIQYLYSEDNILYPESTHRKQIVSADYHWNIEVVLLFNSYCSLELTLRPTNKRLGRGPFRNSKRDWALLYTLFKLSQINKWIPLP